MFFISIAATVAAIYWNGKVFNDPNLGKILVICLTQIETILALFVLAMSALNSVSVGYLRSVDKQINQLCGNRMTNIWESFVAKELIWGRRGPYMWIIFLIALGLVGVFGFFAYVGFSFLNNFWSGVVIGLEAFVILGFSIWTLLDADRAERFADGIFNNKSPQIAVNTD